MKKVTRRAKGRRRASPARRRARRKRVRVRAVRHGHVVQSVPLERLTMGPGSVKQKAARRKFAAAARRGKIRKGTKL